MKKTIVSNMGTMKNEDVECVPCLQLDVPSSQKTDSTA